MEERRQEPFDTAVGKICGRIEKYLLVLPSEIKKQVQEVRIRVNKPVSISCTGRAYFLNANGRLDCYPNSGSLIAEKKDLEESFRNICNFSVYSYENEIKNGFITLKGGHRVGLGGSAVFHSDTLSGMRDISSINIRVAREIKGSADSLVKKLKGCVSEGLLLTGAPSSGKTTLLRDLARQLSGGAAGPVQKVTVVDERGEIAGCYRGIPQYDLGVCCDVLDSYPKAEGILHAVRTLSPDIIICDEIGTREEADAVEQGLNSGVGIIASIHAGNLRDFLKRSQSLRLLKTGAFGSVALLEGNRKPGVISKLYKAGDLLAQIGRCAASDHGRYSRGVYRIPQAELAGIQAGSISAVSE